MSSKRIKHRYVLFYVSVDKNVMIKGLQDPNPVFPREIMVQYLLIQRLW